MDQIQQYCYDCGYFSAGGCLNPESVNEDFKYTPAETCFISKNREVKDTEILTTTPEGVPVVKGQKVRFKTIERRRFGAGARYVEQDHLGRIVDITTSGSGVVLLGVDIGGVFNRPFTDIPELGGDGDV